jgi:hypothetical protein
MKLEYLRCRMWREGIGGRRWYKYCVHKYINGKVRHIETVLGIGEGGIKENDEGGEFYYDIL